jgi:DNA-binding MarR family transcriptional regulator
LTSLADGPKHGYALIKDIESFSGVKMGSGTLYNSISKLEAVGLIEALPADERRYPYRITPEGSAFLSERLNESVRIARLGLRRFPTTFTSFRPCRVRLPGSNPAVENQQMACSGARRLRHHCGTAACDHDQPASDIPTGRLVSSAANHRGRASGAMQD